MTQSAVWCAVEKTVTGMKMATRNNGIRMAVRRAIQVFGATDEDSRAGLWGLLC